MNPPDTVVFENLSLRGVLSLGEKIGARLQQGDWVLLSGDLGAGKTTLAKGIGRGCGYKGPVTSPTFALVHEYMPARIALRHADLYRIENSEEAAEMLEEDAEHWATLTEWPERLGSYVPSEFLLVRLEVVSITQRRVSLKPLGKRYARLVQEMSSEAC